MNRIQILVVVHIVIFAIGAILASMQGAEFQNMWITHPLIAGFLFLFNSKHRLFGVYIRIVYLVAMPSVILYKFYLALVISDYEIPVEFWFVNIAASLMFYIAGILMFIGRDKYVSLPDESSE